jgi:hypothetical protein
MNRIPKLIERDARFGIDALVGVVVGAILLFAGGNSLAAEASRWNVHWELGAALGDLTVIVSPNASPRLSGACAGQTHDGKFHAISCTQVFDVRASTRGPDALDFEYSLSPARCSSQFNDTYAFYVNRQTPKFCTGILCFSVYLWKSWARHGDHCVALARYSENVGACEIGF